MKGLDPYDALAGTRVPGFMRRRPKTRQIVIQLRKRTPLNVAPLLGVKPRSMAKALGCFLTAEARYSDAEQAESFSRLETARGLVASMDEAEGNAGEGAWGYEFDVQTRWAHYGAGSPNLIATFFAGRGLAEAGLSFDVAEWSERGRAAAAYLAERLSRRTEAGRAFFAYTPDSLRLVHNANLLGAGFVAAAGALHGVSEWTSLALGSAAVTLEAQRPDVVLPPNQATNCTC